MNRLSLPVGPNDHVLGPEDAPITLVEYGSYDCPHCRQALVVLEQVREQLDTPIRLVYRHFPRETGLSVSVRAAEAAEAASKQGKFWEMHQRLLENHYALDDASLIAYATMLNLDTHRFAAELGRGIYANLVYRQFQSGLESGVHSTPTYFINDYRHEDYGDTESLLLTITSMLSVA